MTIYECCPNECLGMVGIVLRLTFWGNQVLLITGQFLTIVPLLHYCLLHFLCLFLVGCCRMVSRNEADVQGILTLFQDQPQVLIVASLKILLVMLSSSGIGFNLLTSRISSISESHAHRPCWGPKKTCAFDEGTKGGTWAWVRSN
jgi:hypothetical protein